MHKQETRTCTRIFKCLYEEERCMVSRNLHRDKMHEHTRKRQDHAQECPNSFMRRRGAWFLETFLITRCTNTQGRDKTTYTNARGGEVHGFPKPPSSQNAETHKRKVYTLPQKSLNAFVRGTWVLSTGQECNNK